MAKPKIHSAKVHCDLQTSYQKKRYCPVEVSEDASHSPPGNPRAHLLGSIALTALRRLLGHCEMGKYVGRGALKTPVQRPL